MIENKNKLSAINFFNGDELAASVWKGKYGSSDEYPEDTFERLAKEFVRVDQQYGDFLTKEQYNALSEYGQRRAKLSYNYEKIKDWFSNFVIVPGGSVLESLGTDKIQSLSNCFVNGQPADNVEDIMSNITTMAQIGKRRGGTAADLSNLRPAGASLNNAAKESTGPVSWMVNYDAIGKTIGQQNRKMAMMLSLDGRHPDVEQFITCKQGDNSAITNANISVKIHQDFIDAVEKDEDYILRWPVGASNLSDLIKGSILAEIDIPYNTLIPITTCFEGVIGKKPKEEITGYCKRIRAKELWNKMIQAAWSSGEPGIFNWDRIIDYDPTSVYPNLKPISSNPCGMYLPQVQQIS